MKKVSLIVLAGGKSSRMGRDKAVLELNGRTFLDTMISSASGLASEIVVAGRRYERSGIISCEDIYPGLGPASGIHSGLHHSSNACNIILGTDMPLVRTEFLKAMLDAIGEEDALVCHDGLRIHPLAGIFHKSLESHFRDCILNGKLKMTEILKSLNVNYWKVPDYLKGQLVNINTTKDLELLQNADSH